MLIYHIARKFGRELNLAVWRSTFGTTKLKSANTSYLHIIIPMAIPYRTTKFKSVNVFAMVILGPIAKLNSRQYFRLYSIVLLSYMTCLFFRHRGPKINAHDFTVLVKNSIEFPTISSGRK